MLGKLVALLIGIIPNFTQIRTRIRAKAFSRTDTAWVSTRILVEIYKRRNRKIQDVTIHKSKGIFFIHLRMN